MVHRKGTWKQKMPSPLVQKGWWVILSYSVFLFIYFTYYWSRAIGIGVLLITCVNNVCVLPCFMFCKATPVNMNLFWEIKVMSYNIFFFSKPAETPDRSRETSQVCLTLQFPLFFCTNSTYLTYPPPYLLPHHLFFPLPLPPWSYSRPHYCHCVFFSN